VAKVIVQLEFISDQYPGLGLLPEDSVRRARVCSFIDAVSTKLIPLAGAVFVSSDLEAPDAFVTAQTEMQELHPPAARFAVGGHFSIADAAFAPFLCCWELFLRNDAGKFAECTSPRVDQELFRSPRFARLQKCYANSFGRACSKNSFNSERHVII
ncbi:hypothetical protein EI94DRAFT_1630351, partial [Lactarius quietus]